MKSIVLGICLSLSMGIGVSEEALVGTWKLKEITINGNSIQVQEPIKVVFATEGKIGKFTGNTKKNLFSGLFDLKSRKEIAINGLMSTKMKDSELSREFLVAFEKMSAYQLNGEVLVLSDHSKSKSIKMIRVED